CTGRQEIGNRVFGPAWTTEKLYGPLCNPPLPYVSVLTWNGFIDVFLLQDQSEWFFRAWIFLRKPEGVGERRESEVIIASLCFVRRPALGVAPPSVLQDSIPTNPAAGCGSCRVPADAGGIDRSGKPCSRLHRVKGLTPQLSCRGRR